MRNERNIARDISYAHAAETRGGRLMIRALEAASGRGKLIKRAKGYEQEVASGRGFWNVMVERYGLSLEVAGGSLDAIPKDVPLIVVSNHPYGILDGLMMGQILCSVRGDFRILANSVFQKAKEVNRHVLPISFDQGDEAKSLNLRTRKIALDYLRDGGAIGIFPGGTVSTGSGPFSQPMDPGWRSFTARMVAKSGATVVPIFFEGQNSRMFQIASHIHQTLRLGLLLREFGQRVDKPVRIVVGDPLDRLVLEPRAKDAKSLMEFLRHKTYELSPGPLDPDRIGLEFG